MTNLDHALELVNSPRIASLDVSAFSAKDVLNLVLQRSEIIRDQRNPNALIKAWSAGEDQPLLDCVQSVGPDALIRRAAALILVEYEKLYPLFKESPPKAVTDIGCGYAIFDLFLAQDFDCKLALIDLEESEERHFGFETSGSAYSNLDVARKFLVANGIAKSRIKTINPAKKESGGPGNQDLVVSFLSCGFHYPWTTYQSFFETGVTEGGRIILDLRRSKAEASLSDMARLGEIDTLAAASPEKKALRVLVTRKVASG